MNGPHLAVLLVLAGFMAPAGEPAATPPSTADALPGARTGTDDQGRTAVVAPDPDFDPSVETPAFPADLPRRPRLAIDEAHRNLHRLAGTYARFGDLARHDGFEVAASTQAFSAETLRSFDVLVIANARVPGEQDGPGSAFTTPEEEAVAAWVREGGSLFLVVDHPPFGTPVASLAQRFGVEILPGHAKDAAHSDPVLGGVFVLVFEREASLLGDHAILEGRNADERIRRVVTFGGTGLRWSEGTNGGSRISPVLPFSPTARWVTGSNDAAPDTGESLAGFAQAVAVEHGAGRVVVSGEAGVFSAQVLRGEAIRQQLGRDEVRIGMTRLDTDNRQFALNVLRWLGRAGDGTP